MPGFVDTRTTLIGPPQECRGRSSLPGFVDTAGVQRAQPFAGVRGHLNNPYRATAGVQRAQPFAGVWGVPTKSFLPLLPPAAASQRERKAT